MAGIAFVIRSPCMKLSMFQRRILHHGPSPTGIPVLLDDRALGSCWFELHRLGGCGAGEVILQREFHEREAIQIGDWISFEPVAGTRWYFGRVEETRYQHPGRLRVRLAGMVNELNEVFPGGFDATPQDRRPIRYGDTDLFSNDPDRDWEVAHYSPSVDVLVRQLIQQHVVGHTHISYVSHLIESPRATLRALSVKFRGEESLRSILKDLALRAQADWGVDAAGRFFFLRRRTQIQTTFRMDRDLTSVEQVCDRELIFNRLLLTGDYIYDHRDNSGQIARRVYRWRANYFEPDSCHQHGNRRLRLWVPWIRTQSDSIDFAREFFRTYSQPRGRFLIETLPRNTLLNPWEGAVAIESPAGQVVSSGIVERVRVLFDHAPRFRLEIGPEDPREQWPEPPQDERWEIPDHIPSNGGEISLTSFGSSGGGGGGGQSTDDQFSTSSSHSSSDHSSDLSSSDGSSVSSEYSSEHSGQSSSHHSSTSGLTSSTSPQDPSSSNSGSSYSSDDVSSSDTGTSSFGHNSQSSNSLSTSNHDSVLSTDSTLPHSTSSSASTNSTNTESSDGGASELSFSSDTDSSVTETNPDSVPDTETDAGSSDQFTSSDSDEQANSSNELLSSDMLSASSDAITNSLIDSSSASDSDVWHSSANSDSSTSLRVSSYDSGIWTPESTNSVWHS